MGSPHHREPDAVSESLIESLLGLPWHDQYEVYRLLGLSLGFEKDEPDSQDERQKELAERADALEAMRAAAEHLGLSDSERLAVRDYERARRELGLDISAATIIRRWGAWHEAVRVMEGEPARTTRRQRKRWRAINGSVRSREQHIQGVRRWLESRQDNEAITKRAYDDWVLSPRRQEESEQDDGRQGDGRQGEGAVPLVTADAITDALALPWRTVLSVAREKKTLGAAQRERLKQMRRESGSLGLVSVAYVALLYGGSEKAAYKRVREEDFPVPVAYTTTKGRRAWYRRDIDAHHAGRRVPRRKPYEAQERIMLAEEVRRTLGHSPEKFQEALTLDKRSLQAASLHTPSLVPRPDGRVSHAYYWLRTDVEAWAVEKGQSAHRA